MSIISVEDVRHIALLARLEFGDDEIGRFAGDLNQILEYAEKLQALDTQDVEPTSHAVRLANVFREDAACPSLTNDQALANAPDAEAGCFRVPPIIQET